MDKNMINIDDLVRQRLSGGEEKERPGAWLQMRELLDKEMPEQLPGSGFNWRRTLGFVAGFLILASASVGGYKAITSFRNTGSEKANNTSHVVLNSSTNKVNTATTSTNTSGKNIVGIQKANTTGNINANNKPVAANTSSQVNHKAAAHAAIASNHNKTQAAASQQSANGSIAIQNNNKPSQPNHSNRPNSANILASNNKKAGSRSETLNKTNNNTPNNTSSNSLDESSKPVDKLAVANTANNTSAASHPNGTATNSKHESPAAANNFASGNTVGNTKAADKPAIQNKPVANNAKQSNASSGSLAKNANNADKPANNNKSAAGNNDIAKAENANKRMIDKIETKETYDHRKGGWKKDTVDKGKVEWSDKDETMMAMNGKQVQTVKDEIVPASSITSSNGKGEEKLLPLEDFRVSRKKTNYETSNFFEEMVKNAKMQLGNVKFYPGILLGVNYAMNGNHSMPGFQFGMTGSLSLNEKWGIVAELKYLNSMNGSRISNRNDYMTDFKTVTDQNNNTTYQWDSVEHYFTYATVQSIQMPFMVRYSAKRLNVLLGVNLAYSFIPSPNETSNKYEVKGMTSAENYRPATGAILNPLDFSSRFGIGYLFGIGYQLSPAIQLDGRITQSVWDNAKTPGAELVSKQVYQVPSLQLNLSYRFSSNKYKPYRQHQ